MCENSSRKSLGNGERSAQECKTNGKHSCYPGEISCAPGSGGGCCPGHKPVCCGNGWHCREYGPC